MWGNGGRHRSPALAAAFAVWTGLMDPQEAMAKFKVVSDFEQPLCCFQQVSFLLSQMILDG